MDRELFRNWNYANGDEYSLRISDISPLYEAIRVNNVDLIDNLLKQGENINGSVLPYGPFAGYTILHFACMSEDKSFVERLLFVYNANPNTEAKDGARPITVAVLSKKKRIVSLLLRSGANVDEELSNSIQIKYKSSFKSPEDEWCNDFGSRMTLLTYAVLNNHIELVDILLKYHADWKIRSRSNKTLLMCAVDKLQEQIVESLVKVMSKDELNLRDNDGFTALHYLAKRNELKCRYHASTLKSGPIVRILLLLLTAGADINIKVNGHWAEDIWIIRDLRFRQVVGVPAFEEALLIMHNLLKTGFLHGERLGSRMSIVKILFDELKSHSITFDGQSMSTYDILTTSNTKFLQLAKNRSFCTGIHSLRKKGSVHSELLRLQLEEAKEHIEILNKFKEKSFYITKTFCYLPFDCIWKIIEYLPCSDRENFINALIPKEKSEKNETVLMK